MESLSTVGAEDVRGWLWAVEYSLLERVCRGWMLLCARWGVGLGRAVVAVCFD
jgi:hypothetical protein